MSTSMIGAAGGLSAADKENLIPANLRDGVTVAKVTGTLVPGKELATLTCGHNWISGSAYISWCGVFSANTDYFDSVLPPQNFGAGARTIQVKKTFKAYYKHAAASGATRSSVVYEGETVGETPVTFKAGTSFVCNLDIGDAGQGCQYSGWLIQVD